MTMPIGVGVGLGGGLGHLPAEVDVYPRRLGRTTGGEQGGLGPGGHVGHRHGIGHDGVGDPAVFGHRPCLIGVGGPDDLGQLAEFGHRGLHRLAVGGTGERPRRRHREDDLGLGASGTGELLVEEVERLLGLGPGDGDRVTGRLFDADRHDGQHGDDDHPSGHHIPTPTETPATQPIQRCTHRSPFAVNRVPRKAIAAARHKLGTRIPNFRMGHAGRSNPLPGRPQITGCTRTGRLQGVSLIPSVRAAATRMPMRPRPAAVACAGSVATPPRPERCHPGRYGRHRRRPRRKADRTD